MTDIKPVTQKSEEKRARAISGIAYPYFDLEHSVEVADVIHHKGGGTCDADQLAAWLNYKSVRSGTYMTRVSAAKHFGLIQSSGGALSVTERAKTILAPVMPDDSTRAKADAFLNVPLFSKVFKQFQGTTLPPRVGLVNLFKSTYKILPDRADQATRVFLNSAEQAGFFNEAKDRLVRPSVRGKSSVTDSQQDKIPPPGEKQKGGGGDGPSGVHSAIIGLLRELPTPGTPWPKSAKARFKAAFEATLDFIYPDDAQEDRK